jgi:transcriptional regulator with XRE-family HTH domain
MSMPPHFTVPPLNAVHLHELGSRLRGLREAQGWRLADVAMEAGLSKGQMSELETGKVTNPGLAILLGLQRLYGLASIEELFGDFPSHRALNAERVAKAAGE